MQIAGKHVVVTGGASGIGRALARRFAADGARAVTVADHDIDGARVVAQEIGGVAIGVDAAQEHEIVAMIEEAERRSGPIDIFVSNAGVPGAMGGPEVPDEDWDHTWRVNVMAYVWVARALLPRMLERGEGYMVNTASAAGLLTQVSSLTYSVTKHAAVALAEWMAIEYGDRGIRFSCICPQGVRTPMLDLAMEEPAGAAALTAGGLLDPEDVAAVVVAGIAEERFLLLPHPEVAQHMALKATQPERWLAGMRKIVRNARGASPAG